MDYNTTILSLGYVINPERSKALLLYHNGDAADFSYGKYNGYSDFVQPTESSYEAFARVVKSHTNLTVRSAQFRGSVHWPNFKDHNKSFFAQIFICDDVEGTLKDMNSLGQNRWVTIAEVLRGDLPIWEGDKYILPLVFDDNIEPFHGYMPYERGVPSGWFYQRG